MIFSKTISLLALGALATMYISDEKPVLGQEADSASSKTNARKWDYPAAQRGEQVDDYHGTKVADPYRWLEDPDAAESRAWAEAENKLTFGYLAEIPERAKIRERLTALWNYERFGAPFKEGGRYFFYKNDGLQNQSVLYTAESLDGAPRVLIDPNGLSTDGTVALSDVEVSPDGKLVAYGVAASGSDWQEFKVRDVATGKDLADHLKWIKFSGASWTKDGKGFFYSRYDEPNEKTKLEDANYYQKLYFHRIGTPQSEDELVYERKDQKEWGFGGHVTDDGRYLVVSVWQGTANKNRVYYKDLKARGEVVRLLDDFDASYSFVGNDGPVFYFSTTKDATRGRVVAIDTREPVAAKWRVVVPESGATIESVRLVDERLIVSSLEDARSKVAVYALDGKLAYEVELPGIGSADGFTGDEDDAESFYTFTSFTTPTTVYRLDVKSGKSEVWRAPKVDFDPSAYEVEQVFYTSKDGTRVPMFITHKKGIALDGSNPTILYGYGGFNVSMTPSFSVSNLVWMEMGGVYAVPNLRGGGEYGEAWHEAGTKAKKQNVFDDFIAAAEYLIAKKYTSPSKLAVSGGSNGGLLVGAVLTQRPDLFGAALPAVGVMDMLRFQKFTIGWAWTSDYGSSDVAEEFKALYAYSPLHNIKPGTSYPATLVTTADHDDRVVPLHSYKFAATLQAAQAGPEPILIRIETKAGHGAGKPTAKVIDEVADKFAFLVRELEMSPNR
jgi:prolyl oligopeptidase